MKKYLYLCLMIFVFLVTACGNQQKEETEPSEEMTETTEITEAAETTETAEITETTEATVSTTFFSGMDELEIDTVLYTDVKQLIEQYNIFIRLCMVYLPDEGEKGPFENVHNDSTGEYCEYVCRVLREDCDTMEELQALYAGTFLDCEENSWYKGLLDSLFFESDGKLYWHSVLDFDRSIYYETMYEIEEREDELVISFLAVPYGLRKTFYIDKTVTFVMDDGVLKIKRIQ